MKLDNKESREEKMHENLEKIKEYSFFYDWYDHISIYDLRFLISQAEKAQHYEKALKNIAESNDDSSCNELALKYEVIAEKALNN